MATKTIKLKITNANKGKLAALEATKAEADNLLSFYMNVLTQNPSIIDSQNFIKEMELLTNRTKDNPSPAIPIEALHIKPPSILKRTIIADAVSKMKSYLSNHNNWLDKGTLHGEPKPPTPRMGLRFYYTDYKLEFGDIQEQFVSLRVFDGTKWAMVNYPLKLTKQFLDMHNSHLNYLKFDDRYKTTIKRLVADGIDKAEAKRIARDTFGPNPYYKMCSPTLVYKRGNWYLHFPFEKKIYMKKLDNFIKENPEPTTLAVDLGINHLAVITIKKGDNLLKTEFISGSHTNDLRYKALQKITKNQRKSGNPVKGEHSNKNLWSYVSNLNEDTAHKVSRQIVDLAKDYNVDVIVFENLRHFKQEKGVSKAKKLNLKRNYWLHGKIIKYTRYKAYHEQKYVVERNPFMTSQICYRDTQAGERFSPAGIERNSLIIFEDKSVLNADFNASMNLHRKFYRTFPRVILKQIKSTKKELSHYITENLIAI